MSYAVRLVVDVGGPELIGLDILDVNYTYNTGPMLTEATGGIGLSDLDRRRASEVAVILTDALAAMEGDRPKYLAMNPENGWGNLDGWCEFLREIRSACLEAPKAMLDVS